MLAPSFKKISKNNSIKAFVEGITASVVGALAGSVIVIGMRSIVDLSTALLAVVTVFALLYIKKIQEPWLIAIVAVPGVVIKSLV